MNCGFCKKEIAYESIELRDEGIVSVFFCPLCKAILSVTPKGDISRFGKLR